MVKRQLRVPASFLLRQIGDKRSLDRITTFPEIYFAAHRLGGDFRDFEFAFDGLTGRKSVEAGLRLFTVDNAVDDYGSYRIELVGLSTVGSNFER